MTGERVERRLAAVLAADVAGYSRLMGADEEGTLARLKAVRKGLVDPTIASHRGRIVKTTGDGMLVEFASAVDAVRGAVDFQRGMAEWNGSLPDNQRIEFRIGIHIGDIVIDDNDIFGDGVNIAARLEGIAEPGGVCISDDTQRQIRGKVDVALEDLGQQTLKNIADPMRVWRMQIDSVLALAAPNEVSSPSSQPPDLPDKPSIAVLSFTNMTGDADQEFLGDGIAEEIITTLSRSWSLFVVARNSSFTYKGKAVDVKRIGGELGVRYVLEGSVQRGGNRVRINAQLIDAETGNHLWAERYDRVLNDIFAVQDEITSAVTIAIEPAITKMEQHRAVRKPPESLGAWEAFHRGLWHMGRIGVTENEAAKVFLRQAIELDPKFAPAHSTLALAIFQGFSLYQTSSFNEVMDEVLMLAQRAISLDPLHPNGHMCMGWVSFFRGDHESAFAEARQALAVSPSFSAAHHLLGAVLLFSGSPREGLESFRGSLMLDPHNSARHIILVQIAISHYFLREYDAAVTAAKEAILFYPDHPWSYRWLAAALGQAGRFGEAKLTLQKAIAVAPISFDVTVRQCPASWRREDHEHMLDGLRKAGWGG